METIEAIRCCMGFVLTCAQRVEAWLRISQSDALDWSGGTVLRLSWLVTVASTRITQYLESEEVAPNVVRVHCAPLPDLTALKTGLRELISPVSFDNLRFVHKS